MSIIRTFASPLVADDSASYGLPDLKEDTYLVQRSEQSLCKS